MKRVIKKGGFVFITFPYMSPIRKLKAYLGFYPRLSSEVKLDHFYQFALDYRDVIEQFRSNRFSLKYKTYKSGLKGCKDEVGFLRGVLSWMSNSRIPAVKYIAQALSVALNRFSAHVALLVFQKDS